MGESPGNPNSELSQQEVRDGYLHALHGLEFLENHMREPVLPPVPSKATLDEIRRVGAQLRAERGDANPEPPATPNLPTSSNR